LNLLHNLCILVQIGANWCNLMVEDDQHKKIRFSVSLDNDIYFKLKEVGETQSPKLTLQYLVNYAILNFLDNTENPQLTLGLEDPLLGPKQ